MVSGLCPNLSKCEIAGIGLLKDTKVALCLLKSLHLIKESFKILGVHISLKKASGWYKLWHSNWKYL